MGKISKTVVDKDLRDRVFSMIRSGDTKEFSKINDRQNGIILTDLNGVERYCRIGVIVAEEREDMSAEQLMQSEIDKYFDSLAKKEEKKKANAEKAKKDKAARKEEE